MTRVRGLLLAALLGGGCDRAPVPAAEPGRVVIDAQAAARLALRVGEPRPAPAETALKQAIHAGAAR